MPLAIRLVAASFSWSFSPFAHLPVPVSHGWRVLVLLAFVGASVALLAVVLRNDTDGVWLRGVRGGVVVGVPVLESFLRDQALAHADVAAAEVRVRVRGGKPMAVLDLALRPLAAGDTVAGDVAASVRERLVRLTGSPKVDVRVRHRVLTVCQLIKVLP